MVAGSPADLAGGLGRLIRARRTELGMTQRELGRPFTKGLVSEVERGRSLPSLGVLLLMAERLQVPVSYLLGEVKDGLSAVYTGAHESQHSPPGSDG
jgi:transcriptional regulator with XRE-family HTH domain